MTYKDEAPYASLPYLPWPQHLRLTCCSVLQYLTARCSVLQCVAVCCSVLQCVAVPYLSWPQQFRLTPSYLTWLILYVYIYMYIWHITRITQIKASSMSYANNSSWFDLLLFCLTHMCHDSFLCDMQQTLQHSHYDVKLKSLEFASQR